MHSANRRRRGWLTGAAAAVVFLALTYAAVYHFYGREALSGFQEARRSGRPIWWQWRVIEAFFAPADMVDEAIARRKARRIFGGAWELVDDRGEIVGRVGIDDQLRADIAVDLAAIRLNEVIHLELVRPVICLAGHSASRDPRLWFYTDAGDHPRLMIYQRFHSGWDFAFQRVE